MITLTEEGKQILTKLLEGDKIMKTTIKRNEKVTNTKAVKSKATKGKAIVHNLDKAKQAKETNEANKQVHLDELKTKMDKVVNKANPDEVKKVDMYMFTGLYIGTFPIESETKTQISVSTKRSGVLTFNKKDGKQINAKTKGYANFIKVQDQDANYKEIQEKIKENDKVIKEHNLKKTTKKSTTTATSKTSKKAKK